MDPKPISAEEFDRLFDEGSDEIDQYIDWSKARRVNQTESIVVDLPNAVVVELDGKAERAGLTRQAFLQQWITTHVRDVA